MREGRKVKEKRGEIVLINNGIIFFRSNRRLVVVEIVPLFGIDDFVPQFISKSGILGVRTSEICTH